MRHEEACKIPRSPADTIPADLPVLECTPAGCRCTARCHGVEAVREAGALPSRIALALGGACTPSCCYKIYLLENGEIAVLIHDTGKAYIIKLTPSRLAEITAQTPRPTPRRHK